jgi:predicted permease
VAVNSFTMAMEMDGDVDLAGELVLVSTGLSCVTLFLWIFFLRSAGLI